MVTKQDIKSKFERGMKPKQEDFAMLIDHTFNQSITIDKKSTSSSVALSNAIIDRIVDVDTIELTTTNNYAQFGFITPSAQGKKFAVAYEIANIGSVGVTRWGFRNGYNNSGNGIAVTDQENVVPFTLMPNTSFSGQFIIEQTNTRPNAIAVIFAGGNGAKLRLKQKIYDVTDLDSNISSAIDWVNIKEYELTLFDIAVVSKTSSKVAYRGSNWNGKTWLTIGDSIMANGGIQSAVREQLGFGTIINRGIAGAALDTMLNNVTQQDVDSADLITVYGCFNNFTQGAPAMGTVLDNPSNISGSTFASRFKYMLEQLFAMGPNKTYVIIGTHNGTDATRPPLNGPINGTNGIAEYTEMMGKISRYYGHPFVDMYGKGGINSFNLNTFTRDGLHPNDLGNQRIARILASELDMIQPLI